MVRQVRPWLVVAGLMTLTGLGTSPGRAQDLPPAPLPVIASTPASPAPAPPPPSTPAPALPAITPPLLTNPPVTIVPPPDTYEDRHGLLLRHDPLLDASFVPPGLFAALEADIVGAHFKDRLIAPVALNGLTRQLHVPGASLDWTGAPRLEVGYRLPQGTGELLVSYRLLATEGTGIVPNFDVGGAGGLLKSRLNLNVIDFDYAGHACFLGPNWDLQWKVGVRWASVFYDTRAGGPFLVQYVKNDFIGAGPHLGFDLRRQFPEVPGLEWFTQLESAAVIGDTRQRFEESLGVGNTILVSGSTAARSTEVAPVINFQTGLSWTPNCNHHLRFSGGYQLEYWWDLGHAGSSRGELSDQGLFFRAEFRY
jgi:hypothetical protein